MALYLSMYSTHSIYEFLDHSLRGYSTCNTSGNMHVIFSAQSAELIFSKLFTKIYTSVLLLLITIIMADPTDIDLTKTMKFIFNGNDYICDELINVMFLGAISRNVLFNHVYYQTSSFGDTTSSFCNTTYGTFESKISFYDYAYLCCILKKLSIIKYFSTVFISYNNGPEYNIPNTISCVLSFGNILIGVFFYRKCSTCDLNIPN